LPKWVCLLVHFNKQWELINTTLHIMYKKIIHLLQVQYCTVQAVQILWLTGLTRLSFPYFNKHLFYHKTFQPQKIQSGMSWCDTNQLEYISSSCCASPSSNWILNRLLKSSALMGVSPKIPEYHWPANFSSVRKLMPCWGPSFTGPQFTGAVFAAGCTPAALLFTMYAK
jgi:hypothetical protein